MMLFLTYATDVPGIMTTALRDTRIVVYAILCDPKEFLLFRAHRRKRDGVAHARRPDTHHRRNREAHSPIARCGSPS